MVQLYHSPLQILLQLAPHQLQNPGAQLQLAPHQLTRSSPPWGHSLSLSPPSPPPPSHFHSPHPLPQDHFSQLEVFREDIPRAKFKLNCLLPMCAHNCCILHRLNICGMQCTSYYIGYLHYNIKAGCRDERSKDFYTFQLKVYSCAQPATPPSPLMAVSKIFADQLHRVTD